MEKETLEQKTATPPPPTDQEVQAESKEPTELPEVCGRCKHWFMIMQDPARKLAFGACVNEGSSLAPFGVVLIPGASCSDWEERPPQPKIVRANTNQMPNVRRTVRKRRRQSVIQTN